MGRSNNQRRRAAKNDHTKTFLPGWTKSKTRNKTIAMKAKQTAGGANKKLSYNKMVTKHGKVTQRKFHAGGYNASGKFGKAKAAKKAGQKKKNAKKGE
jgi:hypothetical protein